MTEQRKLGTIVLLLLIAFSINLVYCSFFDPYREVKPDTTFYLAIAKHLAIDFSYIDPSSPWPDTPSLGRAPLWPFVVSIFIKIFPQIDGNGLIRFTAIFFNIINSLLVYLLANILVSSRIVPFFAGLLYIIHPTALYLAELGLSETIFVTLVLLATLLALLSSRLTFVAMFIYGLSSLVRSNFIVFGVLVFLSELLFSRPIKLRHLVLSFIFFMIAPGCWMIRNYYISNHLIFSSIRGETFYGSHNQLTFYDLDKFGYWVFPNEIPNEPKKLDVAADLSEIEIDRYYFNKGKSYLLEHIRDFPRLLFGKLTRAFIPIPWVFDYGTIGVSFYRILLYIFSYIGLKQFSSKQNKYMILISSMFCCNLITVLIFYGSIRFAFVFEPFLIPIASVGALNCYNTILKKWFS